MRRLLSFLLVPVLAGAGWAAGRLEEPAAPAAPEERACRTFPIHIEDEAGAYFETGDRTGPVGAWVGEMEDAGWTLRDVDFELGSRLTGAPFGMVMVCMARPRLEGAWDQ